ncbi:MAG: 5'-nucleotidase C-terminal domain-containing protein [Bacteroidia bacterium]
MFRLPNIFLYTAFLFFYACSEPINKQSKDYNASTSVDSTILEDAEFSEIILPYKTKLDSEMNKVIGYADTILSNEGSEGESSLGNFVADLMLFQSNKIFKDTVHLAVINARGGLRVPINQGEITVGEIFELMPFDNEVLVVEVKGDELFQLFSLTAKKAVNVFSPATFIIRNQQADSIRIDSLPIIADKIYNVAISDYLANGGGGFDFLMDNKRYDLNIMLRDMILMHIEELSEEKKRVYAKRDGRIKLKN